MYSLLHHLFCLALVDLLQKLYIGDLTFANRYSVCQNIAKHSVVHFFPLNLKRQYSNNNFKVIYLIEKTVEPIATTSQIYRPHLDPQFSYLSIN